MGAISSEYAGLENSIDVIVQYTKDGDIIPIRIKIQDEDGMYQMYSIKQYRERKYTEGYTLPNGVAISNHKNKFYEVKIVIFGAEKKINIFFNGEKWFLR